MACPCELLIERIDEPTARAVLNAVATCAWAVEERFSRYRSNNIVHRINTSDGSPITVDEETANLLDFAEQLTVLSDRKSVV